MEKGFAMIAVTCKCGATLKVSDAKAGKKGRCPQCRAILIVPGAAPGEEKLVAPVVEDGTIPIAEDIPIAPEPDGQGVDPLDNLAAAAAVAPAAPAPAPAVPAAAQASGAHPGRLFHPPRYAGVNVLGWIYMILGILTCAAGLIIPVVTVVGALVSESTGGGAAVAGLAVLPLSGVLLLAGFIQLGMGQLFHCVRDIAQNTCYLRKL